MALLGDPELLVLDEPTDGLDPIGPHEVRGILARALARGATLLLDSHLLAETERICQRIWRAPWEGSSREPGSTRRRREIARSRSSSTRPR